MISRRKMFGFLGTASAVVAAAPAVVGASLISPGREVTYLPGGGALIEGQSFTTGMQFINCPGLVVSHCHIEGTNLGMHLDDKTCDASLSRCLFEDV